MASCAANGCDRQAMLLQRELGAVFCSRQCISNYRCDTHQYLKADPTTYAVPIGSPLVAVVMGSLAASGASPDAVMKSKLHSGGAHYMLPVAHVDALIEQLKAIGPLKHGLEEAETQDPKRQTTGAQGAAPPTTLTSAVSGAAVVSSPSPSPSSLSLPSSPMSAASAAAAAPSSSSSSLSSASPPSALPPSGRAGMDVVEPGQAVAMTAEALEAILRHSDDSTMRALGSISPAAALELARPKMQKLLRERELKTLSTWLLSIPYADAKWDDIEYLTALTTLGLSSNELISLPSTIGNLTALTRLVLAGNKLTSLPATIGNLTALTLLDLSFNKLQSLPNAIGNLSALKKLYLFSNKLQSLPNAIGNLKALKELDLSFNKLQSLPNAIGNLSALQTLKLDNNELQSLPDAIGNLSALQTLDLGNNKLQSLPDAIGNLKALKELDLFHNQLKSLPATIGNLAALQTLNLINNDDLKYAPRSILKIPALTIKNRRGRGIDVSTLRAKDEYYELSRGQESHFGIYIG